MLLRCVKYSQPAKEMTKVKLHLYIGSNFEQIFITPNLIFPENTTDLFSLISYCVNDISSAFTLVPLNWGRVRGWKGMVELLPKLL